MSKLHSLAREYDMELASSARRADGPQVSARLSQELVDRIDRIAENIGSTRTEVIRDLLNAASYDLCVDLVDALAEHAKDMDKEAFFMRLAHGEKNWRKKNPKKEGEAA